MPTEKEFSLLLLYSKVKCRGDNCTSYRTWLYLSTPFITTNMTKVQNFNLQIQNLFNILLLLS